MTHPRALPAVVVQVKPSRLRGVVLLRPMQFPLVVALLAVSVVFTIWPDALQHTPITFETQGLIHHIWHYSLLVGSVLCLVGMLWTNPRWQLPVELSGLCLLMGALMVNLIALSSLASSLSESPSGGDEPSGLGLALRVGVILGLAIRAYIIVSEPNVTVISTTPPKGS